MVLFLVTSKLLLTRLISKPWSRYHLTNGEANKTFSALIPATSSLLGFSLRLFFLTCSILCSPMMSVVIGTSVLRKMGHISLKYVLGVNGANFCWKSELSLMLWFHCSGTEISTSTAPKNGHSGLLLLF